MQHSDDETSKKERARTIRDYIEISTRPAFKLDCIITRNNFEALLHPYELKEKVKCQVLRKRVPCGTHHHDGWLGRTNDGREGLIGGHCARKYIKGHKAFHAERIRIQRQIELDELTARYLQCRQDAEFAALLEELGLAVTLFQRSRDKLLGGLSLTLQRMLEGMSKTGNAAVVIQVRRWDEDDKGEKIEVWEPYPLGAIWGTELFDYAASGDLKRTLDAVRRAWQEVRDNPKPRVFRLKATLKALDSFRSIERPARRLIDAVERFRQRENLELLCFLSSRQEDREMAAGLLIQKPSQQGDTKARRRLLDALDQRIRTSIAHEGFRIP